MGPKSFADENSNSKSGASLCLWSALHSVLVWSYLGNLASYFDSQPHLGPRRRPEMGYGGSTHGLSVTWRDYSRGSTPFGKIDEGVWPTYNLHTLVVFSGRFCG
jgi:hypothetical protein